VTVITLEAMPLIEKLVAAGSTLITRPASMAAAAVYSEFIRM
jgi:hypothetical protein